MCSQKWHSQIRPNSDTNAFLTTQMAKPMTAAGDTFPAVPSAPSADPSGVSPARLIAARGSEPVPERREQGWELSSSASMPCAPLGVPRAPAGPEQPRAAGAAPAAAAGQPRGLRGTARAGLGSAPAAPRPQQSCGPAVEKGGICSRDPCRARIQSPRERPPGAQRPSRSSCGLLGTLPKGPGSLIAACGHRLIAGDCQSGQGSSRLETAANGPSKHPIPNSSVPAALPDRRSPTPEKNSCTWTAASAAVVVHRCRTVCL